MRTVERMAARAVAARADALAVGLAAVLPGVRVARDGGEVALRGRGLRARVLDEPALRDPGSVLR